MRANNRVRTVAAVVALAVNIGLILMLIGRAPDPPVWEEGVMQVSLVAAARKPILSSPPAERKRPRRTSETPALARTSEAGPVAAALAPQAEPAPPMATPSDLGAALLRRSLRSHLGCANPNFAALTDAERAKCDEKLGEDVANVRAYPVISPKLKKVFDRTFECKPDDDWCLYRVGKGPYPGLAGLGHKKKISDWDR